MNHLPNGRNNSELENLARRTGLFGVFRLKHIVLMLLLPVALLAGVFAVVTAGSSSQQTEPAWQRVEEFNTEVIGHIGGLANAVELGANYLFAGFSKSSIGLPTCSMNPSFMTTILSARVMASTWSWVT